ncbi:MAG: hypothetical protein IJL34_09520 [Treponema sp.]|nr:hypothetical protein [Treponema sp.]
MKRSGLFSFLVLTVFAFTGCNVAIIDADKDDESKIIKDAPAQEVALTDLIASRKEGSTIKLTSNVTVEENSTINIDKKITIVGSSDFDLKNSSINIKASGVSLKNMKNISTLTVDEAVADGDFYLDNVKAQSMQVNGGGENSGHFSGCSFAVVNVNYQGVRLVFETECHIVVIDIFHGCHIYAKGKRSHFGHCHVRPGVDKVRLEGKTCIENVVTNSDAEHGKPVIQAESDTVEISKACDVDQDGNISEINVTTNSDEVPLPFFEELTDEEVTQIGQAIQNASLEDLTPAEEEEETFLNINNRGTLDLENGSYGIVARFTTPDNVNQINVYRSEHGKNEFYLIGFLTRESKRKLSTSTFFNDYYVEAGKAYDYYANFISNGNNNYVLTTETDTLTAINGRGLFKLPDNLVFNYNPADYTLNIDGDISVDIGQNLNCLQYGLYLKEKGTTPEFATVESSLFSYIFYSKDARNGPVLDTYAISFVKPEDIGAELEIHKAKVNARYTKSDFSSGWTSIPTDAIGGTGFTDNVITINAEDLPGQIELTEAGVKFSADTSMISDFDVCRIQFKAFHNYNDSYVTYSNNGTLSSAAIAYSRVSWIDPYYDGGERPNTKINFYTYDSNLSTTYARLTISCYMTIPQSFSSGLSLRNDLVYTYDEENRSATLNAENSSQLFTKEFTAPQDITLLVDGAERNFNLSTSDLEVLQGLTDIDYTNKPSVTFRVSDGQYRSTNLGTNASIVDRGALYPYRTQVRGTYISMVNEETPLRVQYYFVEDSLNFLPGLPSPIKVTSPVSEEDTEPNP